MTENKERFGLRDVKKLLYILWFFSLGGYLIDILISNPSEFTLIINLISITLLILLIILNNTLVVSTRSAFGLVVYLLIANIFVSHYYEINIARDVDILRSTLIIMGLLPAAAFVLGKKQSFIIGFLILVLNISVGLYIKSEYFEQQIYLIGILIIGYSIGIYYLMYILDERSSNVEQLVNELKEVNRDIKFINSLALDLADFSADNEIVPLLLKKLKQHTKAKVAVYNDYSYEHKQLKVKGIEVDNAILKIAVRIAGEKILNTASPVSDEVLRLMMTERIGFSKSLTEVTFGSISESTDKTIRSLTGINNFFGITHIVSGKLYGTTLLGFTDNQTIPSVEFLKSYSHLAAISLKRNLTEKALIRSESQLRQITDNITDVVFITDMNFNLQYVSPSISNLTGLAAENYTNSKQVKMFPIKSLRKINTILNEELALENRQEANRNRTRIVEVEMLKPDGAILIVSTHLQFIRNQYGESIGIQGVTRDISEVKKFQRQLQEYAQKLEMMNNDKDRFVQILAHDLKNPFNVLLGLSNVLLNNLSELDSNKIHYFVSVINQTAEKTYNLLEELLLWSKSKQGKIQLELEKINLAEVCMEIDSELKTNISKKDLNLFVNINPQLTVIADRNILKTILRNLVGNAIKFTHAGGVITISTEQTSNEVAVAVSDNGVGIENEQLSKLWDNGFILSKEGTENERGTGLGLILCKELIEKQGGKIWAKSEVSKGSSFYFTLPILLN